MNSLRTVLDLRRYFAGQSNLAFDEESGREGPERREHPRIRFTEAPTTRNGDLPFCLVDLSQSGFAFLTSRALDGGTPLSLNRVAGQRFEASIVGSHGVSFNSSFVDRDFRFHVHCRFRDVLDVPQLAELLADFSALTVQAAD